MHTAALTRYDVPHPTAVLLLLHGGKEHSRTPVDWRSTSWHRSHAMQRALTPTAHRAGVATWLLRYRHRGWNDVEAPSPVPDARWALDQVAAAFGDVPVVLVGHSMGARTAVRVADHPSVRGVVALAPWLPVDDPINTLRGRHLAAAHGRGDRITSSGATKRYLDRAAQVAASVEMHDMGPVGHYMLRDVAAWNEFATTRSLAMVAEG